MDRKLHRRLRPADHPRPDPRRGRRSAGLRDRRPKPLVAVGQSLGAYAAAIAADELGPQRLILLAPMIPKVGEAAGDWWEDTGHAEAIAPLTERLGPPAEWDDAAMAEVFYHDVDAATLESIAEFEGVPGTGLFAEPLPPVPWPFVPTTVLLPREDRLFPLEFQRRLVRERLDGPSVEIAGMDGGHLPMLSRPRDLALRLVEVVRGSPPPVADAPLGEPEHPQN